jgi:hypothetical protein
VTNLTRVVDFGRKSIGGCAMYIASGVNNSTGKVVGKYFSKKLFYTPENDSFCYDFCQKTVFWAFWDKLVF